MDAETSDRLPDLLAEMLERPPEEREAFLADVCGGDEGLRAELRSLADQQGQAHEFLEKPAYALSDAAFNDLDQGELKPGDRLGDCEVLRLVGEGGMGEVYLAEDTRLERRVAVKLLKRHLNDALGQRFEHERRMLAGLTHPGVARLYNAAVSDGRAFLVMEYVEGDRLDEYCDKRGLTIEQRLALFRKVCAAVAHAHQHLVIHRDLKPANIRVTPEGEPKLLDFGIAKLVDPEAGHDTAQTVTQYNALTPGYASPEQLRGESVTTATDVYSLGVVLYELLTGRRPFEAKNRRSGDTGQPIRDESVARPGSIAPTADAAERRGTTPGRLVRQLAGDLDNIVLTAMRAEPARRYPSVSQFSEDVRRHLEGQPVSARKETLRYVGAKFISRNKALTAAVVLVLLTLVGGIAATITQARRADEQRRRADRRFDDVRRLADSLMGEINDSVQTLAGSTATQKLIVARALEYLDNLGKEADNAALRLDLATAYMKIGDVQGNPYGSNLGDISGAMASYLKAEGLLRSLAGSAAATPEARVALGKVYRALGDVHDVKGDYAATNSAYRQSLDVFSQLAREKPSDVAIIDELARAYDTLGDGLARTENGSAEQARVFEQALVYRQKVVGQAPGNLKYRRGLAVALMKLGVVTVRDKAHGVNDIRRGTELMKTLSEQNPDNATLRRSYMVLLLKLGWAYTELGDHEAALATRRIVLATRERTAAIDPKDDQAQFDLATAQSDLAESLTNTGQPEAAIDQLHQGIARMETFMTADPGSVLKLRTCALTYKWLGNAQAALGARESLDSSARLGHWNDAQAAYEKSVKLFSDLKARGIVRAEDSDMLDRLAVNLAQCQQAIARLKQ